MKFERLFLAFFVFILFGCQTKNETELTTVFQDHYTYLIQSVTDVYGKKRTPVWLASWNLETEKYPFDFARPDSLPCRVYLDRSVDAPGGATLYWDLPDIAAAVALTEQTGDLSFAKAAKAYVESYLDRCTAGNGIILWGNHYYYDVFRDSVVRFQSSETPQAVVLETESGDLHEMRPVLPPWELLYNWFPGRIETHIRQAVKNHLVAGGNGEFNRHANQKSEYAFLEAGAVLIHSLAFLYSKTQDLELLNQAESILNFSFSNRHPETGLVINSPSKKRWDQYTSTTEIGLWALYVLKAAAYLPEAKATQWREIAERAIQPWLKHGFDAEAGMFYGSLNVTNAESIAKQDDYPYKPNTHTDIWNPLFPTHDYPLHFAECCLLLYEKTGKALYKQAAENWLETVEKQLEKRNSRALYAENYARVIHFLHHYGQIMNDKGIQQEAMELGKEAISVMSVQEGGLLRSHTQEMRYDAVDGLGLLYFAFRYLETNDKNPFAHSFF